MTSFNARIGWDELIDGDRPEWGVSTKHSPSDQQRDTPFLAIEVCTATGRGTQVEFKFRRDLVEVWHHDRCRAVLDRDELRRWLKDPEIGALVVDDLRLTWDKTVDHNGRVAITLPDVTAWTLSPVEQVNLFDKVQ